MWEVLLFVGLAATVLGFVGIFIASKTGKKKLAAVIVFSGMLIAVLSVLQIIDSRATDRQNRMALVTKVVAMSGSPTWDQHGLCQQIFMLKDLPYTFEADCSKEFGHSLRVGDVAWVIFVKPKESEDKAEAVWIQNLTQEVTGAGGTLPCKQESPPAEAPSVSPDAPRSYDVRTRPLPDVY